MTLRLLIFFVCFFSVSVDAIDFQHGLSIHDDGDVLATELGISKDFNFHRLGTLRINWTMHHVMLDRVNAFGPWLSSSAETTEFGVRSHSNNIVSFNRVGVLSIWNKRLEFAYGPSIAIIQRQRPTVEYYLELPEGVLEAQGPTVVTRYIDFGIQSHLFLELHKWNECALDLQLPWVNSVHNDSSYTISAGLRWRGC